TLDAVIVNTAHPGENVLRRYARAGGNLVDIDEEAIIAHGIDVVQKPLVSARYLVRHDPGALAETILGWLDSRMHSGESAEAAADAIETVL
ncbi:MAG TPA: hypothetical protein VFG86_15030, partial [Chloroflexota bacterium]|nr:hypothetical protein [Chloroflexota bacterium]